MNIIGIYPGTFQPPHVGNYRAYEYLRKIAGPNTFVATSDKVEMPNFPLNFQDKQSIWARNGVPIDKIVLTRDPEKAQEITKKFGPDRTVAIFAMSSKDAAVALKNKSGYFLPFQGKASQLEPLNKHSYVVTIPDQLLNVNKAFDSMTLRQSFASQKLSEEQKKSYFKKLFGWYDISLYDLIKKKFAEAASVKERVNESTFPILRRTLKMFVKEVLGQMTQPQGVNPNMSISTDQTDSETAAEKAKSARDQQTQRDLQLKAKDAELKNAKKQRDFYKGDVDKLNRFDIPQANKELQALKANKNI
jgi:hypothetical protein